MRAGRSFTYAISFLALSAIVALSDAGFARQGGPKRAGPPGGGASQAPAKTRPTQGGVAGRFVAHAEHIQPGLAVVRPSPALANPYEGNAGAVKTGATLFVSYNCADCHGADGSGAMGPSLQDGRWHFGGSPAEVFQSIYEGRPDGMPAWGGRIADDQIWLLVSYVRSLSAGKNVATEDFTGKTVERGGH
jgi:cytochrome c oxidase cbb3-type subunit III